MTEVLKVFGLMSGTSLDGIDAVMLETDGENVVLPGAALTIFYDGETREVLLAAIAEAAKHAPGGVAANLTSGRVAPGGVAANLTSGRVAPGGVAANLTSGRVAPGGVATNWIIGRSTPAIIAEAERHLTGAHARAVKELLGKAGLSPGDIAYLGFPGQTILHRPGARCTWQIGDGAALARATEIAVVNDFRSADVAAGGQGAPFAPLYHVALARRFDKPVAVLNVGGVANVTYIGEGDELLAFDTGPGNAPIDDWTHRHTDKPIDRGGALAQKGSVDEAALSAMLDHPYFERQPPKSLDRLDFSFGEVVHLSPEDGAATLTAFTAASIARAREHFPNAVKRWIVCGGGRHNPVLMGELRRRLHTPAHRRSAHSLPHGRRREGEGDVVTAEEAGWRGDFLEAEAFAYLAVRSVKGLPLILPTTTGVPRPMPGGTLHRPE